MTLDDMIRDEKLQKDINRAAKISALSSGKIGKYKYPVGEEILLSNWRQIMEQAKFANSSLGKVFEKQTEKQAGALKSLNLSNEKGELKQIEGIFSQNLMNDLICAKLKEIVSLQGIAKTDELNYKSKCKTFIILVTTFYLLFLKRDTWRIFITERWWWWAK